MRIIMPNDIAATLARNVELEIRRIIRESFRLHQHELPPVDLIISVRARVKDAPRQELHASLLALWKKVNDQCATLPRS